MLLVITIVVGFGSLTMAWFVQPYLEFQEMPKDKMGYWWAFFNLVAAISSAQAYRLQNHFSNRLLTAMIVIIMLFGYFIWGFLGASWPISLIIMLLMYIARGVAVPVFTDWINQQTSSSRRATVLSIKGFGIRMLFAIVAPLLGWWADIFSVLDAFLLMGAILGILITLTIAFYYVCLKSNIVNESK